MKFLIVDDETYARKQLLHLTALYPDLECIGEAKNGIEAVEKIETLTPDLVFLDIQMPGFSGFDVIRQLNVETKPLIVFVTAYDSYAIKAFEVEALDYLVKPVSEERFSKVVEKLRKQKSNRNANNLAVDSVMKQFVEPLTRLPIRVGARIKLKPFPDVFWLDLEDRIVFAQTDEGRFPTQFDSLKELEDRLKEQEFFRINRTHLVNLTLISEIVPYGQNQLEILLKNMSSQPLRVSREQSRKLKKHLSI